MKVRFLQASGLHVPVLAVTSVGWNAWLSAAANGGSGGDEVKAAEEEPQC